MHIAMVISPHADDAAAFCGATLAKLAAQGWRVILARVTDDCKDSFGLTLRAGNSPIYTKCTFLRPAAKQSCLADPQIASSVG